MRNAVRRRFWLETGMAIVSGMLSILTSMQRAWIEIIFGVDPDHRSGTFEWLIVAAFLVLTILLVALASYECRRARPAIS